MGFESGFENREGVGITDVGRFKLVRKSVKGSAPQALFSFPSHRSMSSQFKMALPVRTNLKHLLSFIQKFNSPKRFLCAERSAGNKVRAAVKYFLNCNVWFVRSKEIVQSDCTHTDTH